MVDKEVFLESTADVVLGIIVSVPIAYGILVVTNWLEFTLLQISLVQTITFTIVAFVRKYAVRSWFKKRGVQHEVRQNLP
jgi:hypothetical protein|tara:strand:+ start:5577 stop:5816 length:240 start_codon:yes stop_codon:yes gene_type:complete